MMIPRDTLYTFSASGFARSWFRSLMVSPGHGFRDLLPLRPLSLFGCFLYFARVARLLLTLPSSHERGMHGERLETRNDRMDKGERRRAQLVKT